MSNLDDAVRLTAFHGPLLGREVVPELEALCVAAAKRAGTPIALISLVIERIQYFRAAFGLPADLDVARATNRCDSFCQFVVRDEVPFLVEDATCDTRVPQELVQAYGVRAYLGAPLRVDGQLLGTLCVIDVVPRTFDGEMVLAISSMAAQASGVLERLKRNAPAAIPPLTDLIAALQVLVDALSVVQSMVAVLSSRGRTGITEETFAEDRVLLEEASSMVLELRAILQEAGVEGWALTGARDGALRAALLRLQRATSEGSTFFCVVDAALDGKLTAREAARAFSVLHLALGFFAGAHDAARDALEAAILLRERGEVSR